MGAERWQKSRTKMARSFFRIALIFIALPGLLSTLGEPAFARPRALLRPIGQGKAMSRAQRRRLRFSDLVDRRVTPAIVGSQLRRLQKKHPERIKLSTIGQAHGEPLYRVDVASSRGKRGKKPLRVLVSAGVHGNEPAGVEAALRLVERAVKDKGMQRNFSITVMPMVNPEGLMRNQRKNIVGQDVNRTFRPGKWSLESKAVRRSLAGEKYDLFVDLHGAQGKGFFLIRGKDDGGLSARILRPMENHALLNSAAPDGKVGPYRLHTLGGATSNNPGTFKGFMLDKHNARYSYTLEYPRTLPPDRQVNGLFKLLRSTLYNVRQHGIFD